MTVQLILVEAILFALGFILGYLFKGFSDNALKKRTGKAPEKIDTFRAMTVLIGIMVAFIWTLTVITSVINPEFQVQFEIHAIMGAIVGALFGKDIFNPTGGKK